MSSTSVSLKSLQFLLQHMDANKRFEISQHCPALREIEKSVPLKINCLILTKSSVTVNNTTYEIGIIRKSHVGEAPEYVTASNERGGDPYEVDDYGIAVESNTHTVTPGDLAMKQLTTVLFGKRCFPIYVTKFEFLHSQGVARLPVGLKLQIEQLVFSAGFGASVGVLAPILNESSYPLKKLDVNIWSDEDATSPIVKTAGILRIRVVLNHLQTMSAITNPVVHLHMLMPFGQPTLLEELCIFDFNQEPRFAIETEDILKKLNGVPVDDENVIIPMTDTTNLKVSYGPFPEFAPRVKWAVRFSTEATTQ
ncbi:unnamed protein product [Caenorhabditis brenneri]